MPQDASALITGLTGQDGSFLAELLLQKGYRVVGLVRGDGGERGLGSAEHLRGHVELLSGDVLDPVAFRDAIARAGTSEIYHLAAPSFVPASWERPAATLSAIGGSTATLLTTVRELRLPARVYVAASSEIFGDSGESPQNEDSPCRPRTPYAIAKLAAHQLVGRLRDHDELHASSGITYNHESERRPERFVTRRITRGVAAIALGRRDALELGALDAVRDWSFAGDIVRGAWLMLQHDQPSDYVLASGVGHTVGEFARAAFACVELEAERYVRVEQARVRPPESTPSIGDAARARERLGWVPELSFEQLVERMVRCDLRELEGAGA